MNLLADLILKPGTLDADSERWAAKIPFDNPTGNANRTAQLIREGKAECLDAYHGGERVGILVYRVEGKELLLHAAFAENRGVDLVALAMPQIEAIARLHDCVSVRCHTCRAGLVRKMQAHGFRVAEIILRKDVPNV